MNDTLEELLIEGIDRLTAGSRLSPELASRARAAARRRHHRLAAAGVGAIGTAAAVAVAAVLATSPVGPATRASHHASPGTTRPRAAAGQVLTTAYVVSRTVRAVAARAKASPVLYIRTVAIGHIYPSDPRPGTVQVSWTRGYVYRTSTLGRHGRIVFASRSVVSGTRINNLGIDYRHRTWATTPGAISPGLAGHPCQSQPSPIPDCPGSLASQIRQEIAAGKFKVIGRQFVDGVNAIKLTRVQTGVVGWVRIKPLKIWKGDVHQTLWVDPNTFLPVRWTTVSTFPTLGSGGNQQDFRWLPPTRANLAHLRLPIPPGFHHA